MTLSRSPGDAGAASDNVSRVLRRVRAAALAHKASALRLPPPMRVVERIEGRGTISVGGRPLTDADYWLKDVEEVDPTVFPTGDRALGEPSDAATGQRGTYGWLRTPTKDSVLVPYVGTPMALALQDGRTLLFTVTKVLWVDNYVVQGLTPHAA